MILATSLAFLLFTQDSISVVQVRDGDTEKREAPIEQLSSPDDGLPQAVIRANDASAESVPQLSEGDTDVEFARVEGMDRCSAELLSAEDADYCARRIEARSAEFATDNEATLTAEQILIGEQFASAAEGDVAARSRIVGRRDSSADDRDLQALASITLGSGAAVDEPVAQEDTGGLPTETQALIEAIVERLGNPSGGG